jgi:translation initiation factor IF-3
VRVINEAGEQLGVLTHHEAMTLAREAGLDLVEVVGTSVPPVCKIIDYGKFRYDQTKRERESRKAQHQVKVKEVKISPNISEHDLMVKLRQARNFLEEGNKVKVSCQFRGREITHPEVGDKLMQRVVQELEDVSIVEAFPKFLGKLLGLVLAPSGKKKKATP